MQKRPSKKQRKLLIPIKILIISQAIARRKEKSKFKMKSEKSKVQTGSARHHGNEHWVDGIVLESRGDAKVGLVSTGFVGVTITGGVPALNPAEATFAVEGLIIKFGHPPPMLPLPSSLSTHGSGFPNSRLELSPATMYPPEI
jgi:hypothetical protein